MPTVQSIGVNDMSNDALAKERLNEFFSVIDDIRTEYEDDELDLDMTLSQIVDEYDTLMEDMQELGEE